MIDSDKELQNQIVKDDNTDIIEYNDKKWRLKLDLAIKFGRIVHIVNLPN